MTGDVVIGRRVKTARQRMGLSQLQLARPELSDSYLSLIESGKRMPSPEVVALLARKLDCSQSYLLYGVTTEQIHQRLSSAHAALARGDAAQARAGYVQLLSEQALVTMAALLPQAAEGLARCAYSTGELNEAIALLNQVRDRDLAQLSAEQELRLACVVSACHRRQGDITAAVRVAEEALQRAAQPGWSEELVQLGAELVVGYTERGDLLWAGQFCAELVAAAESLGTPSALVSAHHAAAALAAETGRCAEALGHITRAVAVQPSTASPGQLPAGSGDYTQIMLLCSPEQAPALRQILIQQADLLTGAQVRLEMVRCAMHLARVELVLDRPERAEDHLARILTRVHDLPQDIAVEAHLLSGQTMAELGRFDDAARELAEVIGWLRQVSASRWAAQMWLAAAQLLERAGEGVRSVEAYQQAMDCMAVKRG